MSAENKGKWGALAAALVLLLGGGTGGFFLGKAQTLKQQQQVIDVQDCTTIYATISQISGGKVRADGLEVNDINGRGSFSFTLSEDTPITWHHTKIALCPAKRVQHCDHLHRRHKGNLSSAAGTGSQGGSAERYHIDRLAGRSA